VIRFDQIEHEKLTDVGVRRSHNQDNYAVQLAPDEEQWRSRGHLFLVADGMGAHAVGEKASEQAVRVIPHTYFKHAPLGPASALRKAFIEANASIHAFGQANREFKGTGTTGTALLLRPDGAWVGHVGDSRVYRIRAGAIEQLSYDHSLLWEYARIKRMDPDDVVDIPSNVIHRCLGPEPLVKVDVEGPYPLCEGDIFLLCSDGLSGQVSDLELGAVASLLPPADACRFLVDLANLRGGPDNIIVIIVRIKEGSSGNGVVPDKPPRRLRGWAGPPWWVASLVSGMLVSGLAAYLAVQKLPLSVPTFLLGAGAIIAGLVGLMLYYRREQTRQVQDEEAPQPRIHRRRTCHIEQALVDKLVQQLVNLRQRADEKHAEPNWSEYQQYQTKGDELAGQGNIPGAFREYCRAMLPLTRALHKMRNKEEVFMPVWDKTR
jgi:protein phosphatase